MHRFSFLSSAWPVWPQHPPRPESNRTHGAPVVNAHHTGRDPRQEPARACFWTAYRTDAANRKAS